MLLSGTKKQTNRGAQPDIKPPYYASLVDRLMRTSHQGKSLSLESSRLAAFGIKKIITKSRELVLIWDEYAQKNPDDPCVLFYKNDSMLEKLLTGKQVS